MSESSEQIRMSCLHSRLEMFCSFGLALRSDKSDVYLFGVTRERTEESKASNAFMATVATPILGATLKSFRDWTRDLEPRSTTSDISDLQLGQGQGYFWKKKKKRNVHFGILFP